MNGKLGFSPPRYLAHRLLAGLFVVFSLSCSGLNASESAVFQATGITGDLTTAFYGENEQGPVLVIAKKTSSTATTFFAWTPDDGAAPLPNSFSTSSLRGISRDGRFVWFGQSIQTALIYDRHTGQTTTIEPLLSREGLPSMGHYISTISKRHVGGVVRFDVPQGGSLPKTTYRYFTRDLVTGDTVFMTEETASPNSPLAIIGLHEDGSSMIATEQSPRNVATLRADQNTSLNSLPQQYIGGSPYVASPTLAWFATHGSLEAYLFSLLPAGAVRTEFSQPMSGSASGSSGRIGVSLVLDGGRAYGWVRGLEDEAGHSGGACVWHPNGARSMLQAAFLSDYGLSLNSWRLTSALGGDAAGLRFAGVGTNPAGETEAWLVTLPTALAPPEPAPEVFVGTSRVAFALHYAPTPLGGKAFASLFVGNNGSADLIVTQVELLGTDADMFQVAGWSMPLSIPPAQGKSSWVTFSPTSSGRKNAVLRIHTNDPARPIFDVSLSGLGPAPIPEFTLKDLYSSPVVPENGSTRIGTATVQRSVTTEFELRNAGSAPLSVQGLTVSNTANFSITNAPTGSISPRQSAKFQITFSPQEAAEISTVLRLDIDHPDVSVWQTTLVGTGRPPVNIGARTLDDQPLPSGSSLPPFGPVTVTDQLRRGLVRLRYDDAEPSSPTSLNLTVRMEGPNASEFRAGFPSGTTLWTGESIAKWERLPLEVIFAPTSPGLKEAWIVIENTDERTAAPLRFLIRGEAAPLGRPVFSPYPRSFLRTMQPITVTATGSSSYTFRVWRNGKASTVGQVGPSFTVGAWHFEGQNGRYRLELVNNFGSTLGPEIWVGSVPSASTQVRAPIAKPLVLRSQSLGPSLRYQWFFNGSPLSNSPKHTGVTTANLRIATLTEADAGSYTCRITMPAPDGDVIEMEGSQEVTIFSVPQIVPFSLRPTRVLEEHDFGVLSTPRSWETPTKFQISGLPPGLTGGSTGSISGRIAPSAKPGTYQVTVSAQNAAGAGPRVVVPWVVEPADSSLFGTYYCLFDRTRVTLGGQATVSISAKGAFSARVCNQGEWKSLRGPVFGSGPSGLPSKDTYNPPLALGMAWHNDSAEGVALYSISEGEPIFFYFSVENGILVGGIASDPRFAHFAGAKAQPAPDHLFTPDQSAATYHLHLAPPDSDSPNPDPKKPAGHGFARITLNRAGSASWTGKLGDGSTFAGRSGGVLLAPDAPWKLPLHHTFHKRLGVFQGWLGAIPNAPKGVALGGIMDWHKIVYTPLATDLSYPAGYDELRILASGSRFVPPSRTELLPGWPKPTSPESSDYILQSHAWPEPKLESWETTINAAGSVQWQPVSGSPWRFLKGKLDPKTGFYAGTGQRIDGAGTASSPTVVRNSTFEGLWIPHFSAILGYNRIPLSPQDKPPTHPRPPSVTGAMLLTKDAEALAEEIDPAP